MQAGFLHKFGDGRAGFLHRDVVNRNPKNRNGLVTVHDELSEEKNNMVSPLVSIPKALRQALGGRFIVKCQIQGPF